MAAISVGDLEAILRLKDQLSPALKVASASIGAVAVGSAAAAAAVVGLGAVMISAARSTLAMADQMSNLSGSTGIGVEALQKFKFAGAAVGVSAEQIALGMQRFQRSLVDGSKESAAALKNLGLSAASLRTMLPEQQLTTLLTTISKIPEPAQRTAVAMQLLGRGGAALVPLGASLEEIMHRAEELGVVMDTKTVAASDALGDAIGELEMTFGGLLNQLGAVITTNPQVAAVVEVVTRAIAELSKWVLQNRAEISSWVSFGIIIAMQALGGFVTVLGHVVSAFGVFGAAMLSGISNVLKFATTVVQANLTLAQMADKIPGIDMSKQIEASQVAITKLTSLSKGFGGAAQAVMETTGKWSEKAYGLAKGIDSATAAVVKGIQPMGSMKTGVEGVGAAAFPTAEQLEKMAEAAEKLFKAFEDEALSASMQQDEKAVKKLADEFDRLEEAIDDASAAAEDWEMPQELDEAARQAELLAEELKKAAEEAKRMAEVRLDTFLEGAVNLVNLFGDAWGRVGEIVANTVKQIYQAKTGFEKFTAIARGVGQLGGMIGGKAGGALSGAASGAMMGAAVGPIIPGIGTLVGGVIGGVVGALGGILGSAKKKAEELRKQQEAAINAFVGLYQEWQQLRVEIAEAGAEGVNQVIGAMFEDGKLSEEFTSAANAADYVAASFAMLREAGYSTAAALAKLKPSLELMSKDAKKFAGSAAEPLLQMARFAEKNEKLLQFMDGLAAMAEGLAAMGLLTQDLLNKIAGDLSASIKKMEEAGLSHAQALAMSAEDLYKLKQAAEKSGLTLDDHTQKLIDDAESAGLFEGLADPLEQLVEIEKMMLVAMTALVGVMGGQLPAAVQKMVDAFLAAANRAGAVGGGGGGEADSGGIGEPGGGGGGGRRGFQHGGYLPERQGGYPVRVAEGGTGGEYMIPGKQMEVLVGAIAALADSREGGGGDVYLDLDKVGMVMGRAAGGNQGSFLTAINQAQRRRGGG